MYLNNGVELSNDPVGVNHDVEIRYHGILKNAGADKVYIHCGIDGWNQAKDQCMYRESNGCFSTTLKASAAHELNFCFKDSANNWDNNNGWNWRVRVV